MDLLHYNVFLYESDCEKKVDACKQQIEEARSETVSDAELDLLQRGLEEELEKERLLKEEFRYVSSCVFVFSIAELYSIICLTICFSSAQPSAKSLMI